mgnify:FL=1
MNARAPDFTRAILCASDFHFGCGVWNPFRLFGKRLVGQLNYHFRRKKRLDYTGQTALWQLVAYHRPTAVVLPGDFSNLSLPEEFHAARTFLDRLATPRVPLYVIPGNHDVYTHDAVRRREAECWLGPYLPPEGVPSLVRVPGAVTLCFLPTVRPNLFSSRGEVSREGWSFLRELPQSPDEAPLVVVSHYPLLNRTESYRQNWSHRLRQADQVLDFLRSHPAPMVFLAGHVHRFSVTRDPVKDTLVHVTLPAAFYADGSSRASVVLLQPDQQALFRVFRGSWNGQDWLWTFHEPDNLTS